MMDQTATAASPPAVGFGERAVALIIDWVIAGIIGFIVGLIITEPVLNVLVSLVIGIAYYVGFWTTTGQTPGKMVMKLQVIDADTGQVCDPGKAFIRYIGYIISAIPLGLGFWWVIWDPNNEGWHDKIAKTRVVKVE
jgi:uncharacterized RDD family membrane protein YckC